MNITFEQWQAQECARLNLSVEQHNKLLEVANDLNAAYPGRDAYGAITHIALMEPVDRRAFERLQNLGLTA